MIIRENYDAVIQLERANSEQLLYDECKAMTLIHIQPIRQRLLLQTNGYELLEAVENEWTFLRNVFLNVKELFTPLEKYTFRLRLKSIYDLQVEVFKNECFLADDMNEKFSTAILLQV